MPEANGSGRNRLLGTILAIALPALGSTAHANPAHHRPVHHVTTVHTGHRTEAHRVVRRSFHTSVRHVASTHWRGRHGWISCVPYARSASGIDVAGNAWEWWDNAAGKYQRGNVPEPGSVLDFRANGHMRLGHVAVVTRVINDREIEIEHANWAGGGIARNVRVVDVSESNDWTAVRVGLGHTDNFGSIYPTYGFIYDRPDTGTMVTAITNPAPEPALNPAPRDLRPLVEQASAAEVSKRIPYEEVAEAPEHPRVARVVPSSHKLVHHYGRTTHHK
jgi:surface antigen